MTVHRRRLSSKMLALVIFSGLLCVVSGFRVPLGAAQTAAKDPKVLPGRLIEVRAGGPVTARPIRARPNPNAIHTATINVTYNGFTPQAQAAFQAAVDIWETSITSAVPIEVVANWTALGPGVLGSAGPSNFYRDWTTGTPAPQANVWYPAPLANKLGGVDRDGGTSADINANFSSVFPNWYFGTDGNTPAGDYDFMSVVLHELGHGLGFVGSMRVSDGNGSWGQGTGFPFIYDKFAVNAAGNTLITAYANNSGELASALTGSAVYFSGPEAVTANGGFVAPLYAPNPWQQGSSYSHFNEGSYPAGNANSLMTPQIGTAEAIHQPGPITLGLFRDMGWVTSETPQPDAQLIYLPMVSKPLVGSGVINGNFETQTGWTENTTTGFPVIAAPPVGIAAHSGSRVAGLGGFDNATVAVSQQVLIGSGDTTLRFWYYVKSTESGCTYDYGYVHINSTSVWTKALCQETNSTGWQQATVDLTPYLGQSVTLKFSGVTDANVNSELVVDDVSIP